MSQDLRHRLMEQQFEIVIDKSRECSVCVSYELCAVVVHHGANASGGHYTAMCRDHASNNRQNRKVRSLKIIIREVMK